MNTTQTQDIELCIPADINALPDLTLVEKATLAEIRNRPNISNGSLARLLGLSYNGVRAMLRRLNRANLITVIAASKGGGREIRLKPGRVSKSVKQDDVVLEQKVSPLA